MIEQWTSVAQVSESIDLFLKIIIIIIIFFPCAGYTLWFL